jgi:hypothetical protein
LLKWVLAAFGIAFSVNVVAQVVTVSDAGPSTDTTCTLAQAINAANAANGVTAAADGSTAPVGNCLGAALGTNTILFSPLVQTITLTGADNHWYGANALPPIASGMQIIAGNANGVTLIASHTGDPAPATADAFRFFYVSGGFELPAGQLLLVNMVLRGGIAKGGDSSLGGGGAGLGGAIFNQGTVRLTNVSLLDNSARGGSIDASGNQGGGGIGEDGLALDGGAVGGSLGNVAYGGNGSAGSSLPTYGGGGGGGFVVGSNSGTNPFGATGGGMGGLGGAGGAYGSPGPGGGDGGGGGEGNGGPSGAAGGSFGVGGTGTGLPGGGGGGGVGGGGGAGYAGGGGGFGAGGGYSNNTDRGGTGGFGGGAGSSFTHTGFSPPNFGGGYDATGHATGGAGMGGAIFNHAGTVALINVTATGNSAIGGVSGAGSPGSGLGAVLFNLNGEVTIDFSTLAGNTLGGSNALADASGPADGAVYSLAYGYKISTGGASAAALTINNSIVHGTQGATNADVVANVVPGNTAAINTSSLHYAGKNLVQHSYTVINVTQSGSSPNTVDPLLGSLSHYLPNRPLPVLPIGANSPATDATTNCSLTAPGTNGFDERNTVRPQGAQCDIGAYEFDDDYIFANGVDAAL